MGTLSKHHRKPRSIGGSDDPQNLSYISQKLHKAWHILFGNKCPQEIAKTINEKFLDPEWELVARRK